MKRKTPLLRYMNNYLIDDKKKNYSDLVAGNSICLHQTNFSNQSPGLYAAEKPLESPSFVNQLLISKHFLLSVWRETYAADLLGLLVQPNQFKMFYALISDEHLSGAEESDLRSLLN